VDVADDPGMRLEPRFPIPKEIRESRSNFYEVEAMKTFLGVLETDVFKMDMELGDIGPRGEEREAGFVGERLDWPGQKSRIFPLGFKEGTVARPAADTVGVDAMAEEEDDEDEDIFNNARGNNVHPVLPDRQYAHYPLHGQR
jgi:hypothetical protein